MSHSRTRRWLNQRSRSKLSAVLAAVALGCAGVAVVGGAASAVPFSEVDLRWSGAPPSVGNGDVLHGIAHVNLNDSLGAEGADADHVVQFHATDGIFVRLPSACRTDGDPVSLVSATGTDVRCNLGRVRYGTAVEVDFTVLAHGPDGGAVRVVLTDGARSAVVPPVPVTAAPGIDVVFNEAQRVQANAAWQATFPVSIALPAGAADLSGPISFDVVVANKTSTNAPAAVTAGQDHCVPLASSTPPSSMPATSSRAPIPQSCTITTVAAGTLRVTLSGYRTPAAVDPPMSASDGSNLPTDRHFFASFGLPLQSTAGVLPATSSFQMVVTHVKATTTSGAIVSETDTSNNTEAVAITVPGGYAHNWAHPAASPAPMDTRVVGGGGPWAATYYAAPGDQIISNTTTGVWGGVRASEVTPGATWSACEVLDGPGSFDGYVMGTEQGTNSEAIAALPPGTYAWSVYRGALPAPGDRDTFNCGSVRFTPTAATTVNSIGGECGCTHEERLTVTDPATITAIKLTVDPAALARASALSVTPPRIGMHNGVRISAAASAADQIWTLGSANDHRGVWATASGVSGTVAPTPGGRYGATNALRDLMRVIGARPYVEKSVDRPDVRAGDVVTYAIRTGAEADLGGGTATWTLRDTIPAGVDYLDGSASRQPDEFTRHTDGTTTLSWSLHGPVNTDSVVTYRARIAFTSGTRTNTAVASIATGSGSSASPVETDQDSADVVYAGDGRTVLTKHAGSTTFAAGGANTWTLDLANLDTVDQAQTDIIDVLPWNGDARGTSYHGRYAIDSVSEQSGDHVFYTTSKPATIDADPAAPVNGRFAAPSPMWSPSMPTDPRAVTAIRIVGTRLVVGGRRSNTIRWHPINGRTGDHFENIAWAKATHTRLQMIKAAATSTVADGSKLQIAKDFTSAAGWLDGDTLTYATTVHNPSAYVAHDVRVHDIGGNGNDPKTVRFSEMSQGRFDGASRTWVIGDLPAGATVTARVTTEITIGADRQKAFQNVAYVENPSNPYQPPKGNTCQRNNQDVRADTDQCDEVDITPPHLRIDKRVDGASQDGSITWTIHVRVDGSTGAHEVTVEDTYPSGTDLSTLRVTTPPTHGTIDLRAHRWLVGDLKAGEVASVSFSARVVAAAGTAIVNVANVNSPDVVPPPPNPGAPLCQINDGPTIDAALDADTDQCDRVETVRSPPKQVLPAPSAPGPDRLPDTGGPARWIMMLGGTSGVGAVALALSGRRRRPGGGLHRS